MFAYIFFTYRRTLRRWRRQVRLVRRSTGRYVDKHIWGKWHQFRLVRRLFIIWFGITAIMAVGLVRQSKALARLDEVARPLSGGTYTEAVVGSVKVINPVLPESASSASVNRLIFSGLTQYDNHRHLVGDLATKWEVSTDGKTYTFHLRPGVKWHDGVPFSASDVLFTLAAIQNPDSRSPLAASWQGVTATAPDDHTVIFSLPAPFTPFIDSTTVGIVPRHLLESIDPSGLREASFNQAPIGTGPFKLAAFEPKAGEVTLSANSSYYAGKPRLDNFTFKLYDDANSAVQAYVKHQVDAIGRVQPSDLTQVSKLQNLKLREFNLPTETILFERLGDSTLSNLAVRQAIAQALDRHKLAQDSSDPAAIPLTQPILPAQIGYTTKYFKTGYNPQQAESVLAAAGWTKGSDNKLIKNGKPLQLTLVTLADSEYTFLAMAIRDQLKDIGLDIKIKAVSRQELQQSYIRPRNYQLLLYGLNIGADPDVYAYWHSTQAADPGLNLSQYSSAEADKALESGRVKQDPLVRQGKYESFLKAWNSDIPAVVIETMPYFYGVSGNAMGIISGEVVDPSDRFYQVEKWTIRTRYGRIGKL